MYQPLKQQIINRSIVYFPFFQFDKQAFSGLIIGSAYPTFESLTRKIEYEGLHANTAQNVGACYEKKSRVDER
jgi:hypothetical protein